GGAASVSVHQGCLTSFTVASPADGQLVDPVSGKPGVRLEIRDDEGAVMHDAPFPSSVATWWDGLPDVIHLPGSEVTMRGRYRPSSGGRHVVGAAGVGRVRISVDGAGVAEAIPLTPHDIVEALSKPPELRLPLDFEAGRDVE